MDRRFFLAASGLAAVSPALAQGGTQAAAAVPPAAVNFYSDGIESSPLEYATRLQQAAASGALQTDNYSLGGAVETLERKFAEKLGKEAAMFVPTGTLANHLAVRKLAGIDRRVLVQAESHLYNDSGDTATTLSGLNLVPLARGEAAIGLDELRHWIERSAGGRVETKIGVLSIESPVRRKDHSYVPFPQMQALCSLAREHGIRLHLDGARMFSLPLHTGRSVRDYAALFDTVYVSTWKHFDAASGAILAGDASFIQGLFHVRRQFGGALPHAWPLMALAEASVDGFEAGYARAWKIADRMIALLESDPRFRFRKLADGTSRFFMSVSGVSPERFTANARQRGVLIAGMAPGASEIVMQVNLSLLGSSAEALAQNLIEAASG
jgi:threonine aldolase